MESYRQVLLRGRRVNPAPEKTGTMDASNIAGRQLARGDCRIGDWVRAADVPEWINEGGARRYRPGSVVISPEAGVIGGVVPAEHPVEWVFEPVEIGGETVWRRER